MRPQIPRIEDLDAIFFDFDGVILESTAIKNEAFEALFADHPEHLPRILEYHHRHLGLSRFEKFEWIYRELLGEALTPEQSERLGRRFSELVLARMVECPFVPGAVSLLESLQGRVRCFVVSGTPETELREIVRRRSLERFFVEVWGSPEPKSIIVQSLLSRFSLSPDRVLMIGDGRSDFDAAIASGLHFVARESPGSIQGWSKIDVPRVEDFRGLARLTDTSSHS